MKSKVVSVNRSNCSINLQNGDEMFSYSTEDKNLLRNARPRDIFSVHEGEIIGNRLIAKGPPLIAPDREELDYYVELAKINLPGDYDFYTRASTSFTKQEATDGKGLSWWRKNIVQRSLALIGVSMPMARKVANLLGSKNLQGVYEDVLQRPLVYPFLSLEICQNILAMFGKKITPDMLPLLKVSRKIYDNLSSNGWLYTPEREVKKILPDYGNYIKSLETLKIVKEGSCFYYVEAYNMEKQMAEGIKKLASNPREELDEVHEPSLSEKQNSALNLCLREAFVMVDGCAGSGKSTLISVLTKYLPSTMLLSLTGKAVSRLKKITNAPCMTIHKLIYGTNLLPDVIIVDEASMLPLVLLVSILSRYPLRKLILVGDPFQLPPIDYGRVFERLLESNLFNSITLDEVFRTNEDLILANSYNLRSGKMDGYDTGENFTLMDGGLKEVFELVRSLAPEEVTVISPYVRPLRELNRGCQEIYHKKSRFYSDLYGNKYYKGDKVMCTENDYDRDVFNGETGTILELNDELMRVAFPSGSKDYKMQDEEDMSKIMLAYAMSVHKSQGSEHDNIILFLENRNHGSFINQRMIYTALTRAKKRFFYVGSLGELRNSSRKTIAGTYDNILKRLRES